MIQKVIRGQMVFQLHPGRIQMLLILIQPDQNQGLVNSKIKVYEFFPAPFQIRKRMKVLNN